VVRTKKTGPLQFDVPLNPMPQPPAMWCGGPLPSSAWLTTKTIQRPWRRGSKTKPSRSSSGSLAPHRTLVFVAIVDGEVCGFGHINHDGVIGLLYVAPEARFLGASTAMLEWLENEVARLGIRIVRLESSLTAKRFYEARGYVEAGEPTAGFGITKGWPIRPCPQPTSSTCSSPRHGTAFKSASRARNFPNRLLHNSNRPPKPQPVP